MFSLAGEHKQVVLQHVQQPPLTTAHKQNTHTQSDCVCKMFRATSCSDTVVCVIDGLIPVYKAVWVPMNWISAGPQPAEGRAPFRRGGSRP